MRWWWRLRALLEQDHGGPLSLTLAAVSAMGVAASITMLFWGGRAIMDLGGFVARGGPYEIAHPAPGWVWVMPVSIWVGLIFGGLNAAVAHASRGPNLVGLAWSGLFLSLGWNFLEYGLDPPTAGIAWGWLVCAAVFIPMGAAPLWWMVRDAVTRSHEGASTYTMLSITAEDASHTPRWLALYTVGAVAGIGLATWAFRILSS